MMSLLFKVSLMLLMLTTISDAIINETVSGFLFTLPDEPSSNQKTRDEAQQWCIRNNSTLAEIYNSNVRGIVAEFLTDKNIKGWNFWINGLRTQTSWQWVNGQSINENTIHHQTGSGNDFAYLQLVQNDYSIYATLSTDKKGGYICEVSSNCNGEFSYNSRCYKINISRSSLTWYEARNECLKGKGDLASFDFISDDQTLKNLTRFWLSNYSSTSLWIGITRQRWTWQGSKTEILYTNWQDSHPNLQPTCLLLVPWELTWADIECNNVQLFFCLREFGSTTTTASATSLTSPTHLASDISATSRTILKNSTSNESKLDTVALGVGIGVGVGGFLNIIIIVIVILLLIRKRRSRCPGNSQNQKRLNTPDVLPEDTSNYAEVQRNVNDIEMKANDPKAIYAQVQPTI